MSAARVHTPTNGGGDGKLPTPLAGLLSTLPTNGAGWSQATRDRFITTFEAVLDYCIPIKETADTTEASAA
jgi:hypothetical protein